MTTLSQRALILYRRRRFINQAPLYLKRLCIFGPKGAIQIRYYYYLLTYLLAYLLTGLSFLTGREQAIMLRGVTSAHLPVIIIRRSTRARSLAVAASVRALRG